MTTLSSPVPATETFQDRHGRLLLGGAGRVTGVDVARGVAVLGMFAAHVGFTTDGLVGVSGWLSLAHGRSSILFALVAGVSLALVTGGPTPVDGLAALQARTRVLVRAVLLLVLAGLLDLFGTRVLLILGFYASYFLIALPFLRWPARRLAAAAVVVGVIGPPLCHWLPEVLARAGLHLPDDGTGALTDFLLTGAYPAAVWMAYVFAGMAIGRCDLRSRALRWGLVGGGLLLAAACYAASSQLTAPFGGAGAVARAADVWSTTARGIPLAWSDPWPTGAYLWLAGPHTDTWLEVFGSGGFAAAVLGLCLFAGKIGRWALAPIAAVGAMALSVYSAQIVAIWAWGPEAFKQTTNLPLLAMVLVALAAATAWRWALGQGPLERVVAAVTTRAASYRLEA